MCYIQHPSYLTDFVFFNSFLLSTSDAWLLNVICVNATAYKPAIPFYALWRLKKGFQCRMNDCSTAPFVLRRSTACMIA